MKILKTRPPRNVEVHYENLTVQAVTSQKKLTCVSICDKDFKKHLLIKVNIQKFL